MPREACEDKEKLFIKEIKNQSVIHRTVYYMLIQCILLSLMLFAYMGYSYFSGKRAQKIAMRNLIEIFGQDLNNKLKSADTLLEQMLYKNENYDMLQSKREADRHYALVALGNMLKESVTYNRDVDAFVIAEGSYQRTVDYENTYLTLKEREALQRHTLKQTLSSLQKTRWRIEEIGGRVYLYKGYIWQKRAAFVYILADNFMGNPQKETMENTLFLLVEGKNRTVWGSYGEGFLPIEIGKKKDIAKYKAQESGVEVLKEKCKKLAKTYQEILGMEVTSLISHEEKPVGFYAAYKRAKRLIEKNVSYFGSYFYEEESIPEIEESHKLLDIEALEGFFEEKKKIAILSLLKQKLNERVSKKLLDDKTLKLLKAEFLQAVYLFLGKENIYFSTLLKDEHLDRLEKDATQSVIDFLRWVNYLADLVFALEEEVRARATVSDRINRYIAEHYAENIGRNEIAEEFGLTGEYIAKIYKKESKISLSEAIADYRIKQAKYLLKRGERVSYVASKVGFDNCTYFSTTFKKLEGITPNQYRKKKKCMPS